MQKITQTQPPEVQEVAQLIAGRTLVVIGGRPNETTAGQIAEAFGCTINWVASKRHDPPKRFEPHIAKAEVIMVLLLIRWSSHIFGEVEPICEAHGKFLVRVRAGYNTRTLAREILEQAGKRLAR
jgi:hypothetical protein